MGDPVGILVTVTAIVTLVTLRRLAHAKERSAL